MTRTPEITVPVAFMTVSPERVTALVTNILAVGGGFLAGFILVGVAAYFADRRLTGGKTPAGFHSVLKRIGGVLGALLVAFIVFGQGDGGGGGTGDGTGPADQTHTGSGGPGTGPAATPPTDPTPPPVVTPPPVLAPAEDAVVVTVLSGANVHDGKFYLVGTDPKRTPLTLDEVKEQVKVRRQGVARPVAIDIRLPKTTDPDNGGVRELEKWAREQAGLSVTKRPSE